MIPLDSLHLRMQELFIAELRVGIATGSIPQHMDQATDEVFCQCPGGECCHQCAAIFCPWGEPLHFHHDGCPCCSSDPEPPKDRRLRAAERKARWQTLLARNTK